jgi:integrase
MVRRFASWLSASDPRTEIPPVGILPHRYRRKTPHIYTDTEIKRLLRQAQQLPSSKGLRASTFTTLFGLLAVTGMRVNEALGLDRQDVDLTLGILHIRRTKFGKSRYVQWAERIMKRIDEPARFGLSTNLKSRRRSDGRRQTLPSRHGEATEGRDCGNFS